MDELKRGITDQQALELARDAEENGTYLDVHCWVFTPQSFVELMMQLARCGLLEFSCDWLVPTARNSFEFFVCMRPEPPLNEFVRVGNALPRARCRSFTPG